MKEKQKHSNRQILRIIGIAVCIAVFLFALFNIISIIQNYREIDRTYNEAVRDYTRIPSQEERLNAVPDVDFEELTAQNDDIIGWIFIDEQMSAILCSAAGTISNICFSPTKRSI